MIRLRIATCSTFLAATALLAACGEDGVSPKSGPICGSSSVQGASSPTFRLTGGERPTISWSPACRLTSISVLADVGDAGGGERWTTFHSGSLLVPPIRWGVLQHGAGQDSAARPLLPRSTYRIYASYQPPQPAPYEWSMRSHPFTACGVTASSACVTTPEVFSSTTADGVTFTASVSKSVVTRGDTAWIEFTLRNTTSTSRTIGGSMPCSSLGMALERPNWKRIDFVPPECQARVQPIVLPAGGATTIRYAFTGLAPNPAFCLPADTYTIALYADTYTVALRDGSNGVSVVLRERSDGRAKCTTPGQVASRMRGLDDRNSPA